MSQKKQIEEYVELYVKEVRAGKDPIKVMREIESSTVRSVFLGFLEAIKKRSNLVR